MQHIASQDYNHIWKNEWIWITKIMTCKMLYSWKTPLHWFPPEEKFKNLEES